MSDYEKCMREGCVCAGDDFSSPAEVLKLFGIEYRRGMGLTSIPKPNDPGSLICLFKEDGPGKWHRWSVGNRTFDRRGWEGVRAIKEFHDDDDISRNRYEEELSNPKTRYVFYRREYRGYSFWKFAGVFRLDKETSRLLNYPPPAFSDWYDGFQCYYQLLTERGLLTIGENGSTEESANV